MKRDTNHHSIVISKFHWAEITHFICLVCSRNGITALVARSGGLWICSTGYSWGSLSIIPPGFAFDSKRLLLLLCTCPLERIPFLWAVQLLIAFCWQGFGIVLWAITGLCSFSKTNTKNWKASYTYVSR